MVETEIGVGDAELKGAMSNAKPDEESGSDDPIIIKKLKTELTEGNKLTLSPVKLAKFKKAMTFTDIRHDFVIFLRDYLRNLAKESSGDMKSKLEETTQKDILTLVGSIASKGNFETNKFLKKHDKNILTDDAVLESYLEFKKFFSELWAEIMKWNMTPSVHRNVVILLPEKVMMHLTKPLHMSDFLLESFKLGGPVSLVSLHGIFLLMQNFNFEVADFYTRLYSMFTFETLSSKYRARFFAYSREFLSSTHLPEIMVASFIKRLSRLSLLAPTSAIPMIFDFITNLLIQHPGLKTLLSPLKPDRQPKIKDLEIPDCWDLNFEDFSRAETTNFTDPDPFDENELDPMKTKAIDSWLCEIKTLQNHAVSSTASKAKFINKALPKVEVDLDETLSLSYKDIEEQERELDCRAEEPTSVVQVTSEREGGGKAKRRRT